VKGSVVGRQKPRHWLSHFPAGASAAPFISSGLSFLTSIKDTDCDPVIEIMSRVFPAAKGAVSISDLGYQKFGGFLLSYVLKEDH
jgi:hypothetical protein